MDIPPAEKKQEEYEAGMEGEQVDEQAIAAETAEEAPVETAQHPASQQQSHQHASHAAPAGPPKPGRMDVLKQFYRECVRVFKVTKKPDKQEFTTIVKVSAIGILIIGAIGFIVHLIQRLFIG